VFDVAVDARKSSPTFGHWVGEILSADNCRQMWVPPGFAHGFLVLADEPSSFTRLPTITRPSMNAASSGMTVISRSIGPLTASSRVFPTKINMASLSPKPSISPK
jgi:hypothetical protein